MATTKVKVVVPIYKSTLEGRDRLSFIHNAEILSRYPMALVAPEGLNIDDITALAPQAEVIRVSKDWLGAKGIAGYNDMMLSKSFYHLFADCN